ncbi:LOW QUALITY PROTEIN: KAT8 regulatory NSL complex subunit 1 [Nilaparvata lugens]|uniref:LOW QUALITY PROTEIN: KAT8 regulatory NSL complex subunit 1 n=1 Tax=Nilaparvata lugens TaxID=108931 RepID=UPI00193DCCA3|nr:LOW QUALITY PROTEIN: KAT8 regulatory NSL complex subunit 1 [Nilaparvata lugens]
MGPRFASLRRLNVDMAPALTDARQTQNLNSSPRTVSSESTIIVNKITNGKHVNGLLNGDCIKGSTRVNGDSVKTDVFHHLNTTEHRILELSNGSLNKPKIKFQTQETFKERIDTREDEREASDSVLLHIGGFMMNNSSPSMGDLDGNMGLNKSEAESLNYMKDKTCCSTDVDQLFKNFQNVDEILQVIKSMESTGTDGEADICAMDPGPSNEGENLFPIADTADITSSLGNFEKELFNDVDVMNICVDENLGDNGLVSVNKETMITEKLEDVEKKHHHIERKLDRLMRRLRKIQAREIGKQASEEVTGVLEHLSKIVSTPESTAGRQHSTASASSDKINKRKTVNDIRLLMRRLDQASQQQALAAHRHSKSYRYFGSGSKDIASSSSVNSANGLKNNALTGSVLPKLSDKVRNDVETTAGNLQYQLKSIEDGFDSDATASSSGGESCDEMQSYNNQHQQQLTISKRAAWRWAVERAEVASRWGWMQAQIWDLDYRIKKMSDAQAGLRLAKGEVRLLGPEPTDEAIVVNGYHSGGGSSDLSAGGSGGSSRTRPLVRSVFGKRKLVHADGAGVRGKKSARPTTVRCGCQVPPQTPCIMCDPPRPTPSAHPHHDLMSVNERIAMLDPAFHPVLSFPSDVSQSIHFEALMKNPDWQQKAMRSSIKLLRAMESVHGGGGSGGALDGGGNLAERRHHKLKRPPGGGIATLFPTTSSSTSSTSSSCSSSTLLTNSSSSEQQPQQPPPPSTRRRKYTRGLEKSTANALSKKIKKKLKLARGRKAKSLRDPNYRPINRINHRKRVPRVPDNETDELDGLDDYYKMVPGSNVLNSNHASPAPSPTPTSAGSKEYTRRKRENSYDIDNIVIPYSVASATRLEKLQYKEILTPITSHDSDTEDISEETMIERHDRCEVAEKKKFSTYLKLPNSMRGRHRRTDSRAESSGANTPDPMSPSTVETKDGGGGGGGGSPITSPPVTPLSAAPPPDPEAPPAPTATGPGRRRTVSLSRLAMPPAKEKDDTRPNTPDNVEVMPYERRVFPLSDDVYEQMLKDMPTDHPFLPITNSDATSPLRKDSELDSEFGGSERAPQSPAMSDTTESAPEEDPNDPEWTFVPSQAPSKGSSCT